MNKTSFGNLYGTSGTTFPDNTTAEISEGDIRGFGEAIKSSAMFIDDNFIDEDDMSSDSATKAPSQQSVKAFVAAQVAATGLSGTYTPTLTAVSNLDSSNTPNLFFYTRIGDVVHVSGWFVADPTTIAALTSIGISIPVASDFASSGQAIGNGVTGEREVVLINGDVTNNRVQASWIPSVNVSSNILVQFSYRVV